MPLLSMPHEEAASNKRDEKNDAMQKKPETSDMDDSNNEINRMMKQWGESPLSTPEKSKSKPFPADESRIRFSPHTSKVNIQNEEKASITEAKAVVHVDAKEKPPKRRKNKLDFAKPFIKSYQAHNEDTTVIKKQQSLCQTPGNNSPEWLQGPILSRSSAHDEENWDDMQMMVLAQLGLGYAKDQTAVNDESIKKSLEILAAATICHSNSTFINLNLSVDVQKARTKLVDEWSVYLAFVGMHSFHHAPAIPEAVDRQKCLDQKQQHQQQQRVWDYECPSSKFLVVPMPSSDIDEDVFGQHFHTAVMAMLVGIASDRLTLFIRNDAIDYGCDGDDLSIDCIFLPITPCTVTHRDLQKGVNVSIAQQMDQQETAFLQNHENDRILRVMDPDFLQNELASSSFVQWIKERAQLSLHNTSKLLVDSWKFELDQDFFTLLEEAVQNIMEPKANHPMTRAALLYLLRPRTMLQQQADHVVQKSITQNNSTSPDGSLDPGDVVGFPLEGVTSCQSKNARCLSFDAYMKLAQQTHKKGTILLTGSKDTALVLHHLKEQQLVSTQSFPFRFITNHNRVKQTKQQAGAGIINLLADIKLQLHATYVAANCCSKFHLMLLDLLESGCGLGFSPTKVCLQEHEDPAFQLPKTCPQDSLRASSAETVPSGRVGYDSAKETPELPPEKQEPTKNGVMTLAPKNLRSTSVLLNKASNDDHTPLPCFSLNSKEWLEGPTLSNTNNATTDEDVMSAVLLHKSYHWILSSVTWQQLLGDHTICHAESVFRNPVLETKSTRTREQLVEEWHFRLTYLALHIYHYAPALAEAQARKECISMRSPEASQVSLVAWDFECVGAKFLVVPIPLSDDLGQAFRFGAVQAILLGIALGRQTVFVNNVMNTSSPSLGDPWELSSCDRHDMQCFFLPTSPCTITIKDLRNATILPMAAVPHGDEKLPEIYDNERVLVTDMNLELLNLEPLEGVIQNRLFELINSTLSTLHKANRTKLDILKEAAERIHKVPSDPGGDSKDFRDINLASKAARAALLYLLRPQSSYQQEMTGRIERIVPSGFDPAKSIGVSIRGTNCKPANSCLSFAKHMTLAEKVAQNFTKIKRETNLVLTSQHPSVLSHARHENNTLHGFRFVMDKESVSYDRNEPLLQIVTNMKLQLHTGITIGDCCSGFYLMLRDIMSEGCGAKWIDTSQLVCLQDVPGFQTTKECISDGQVYQLDGSPKKVSHKQSLVITNKGEENNTAAVTGSRESAAPDKPAENSCFRHNSPEWIKKWRLNNNFNTTADGGPAALMELILSQEQSDWALSPDHGAWKTIGASTICHHQSSFRNPVLPTNMSNAKREQVIDDWHFRLTYWSLHHHFHAPAVAEAAARKECMENNGGDEASIEKIFRLGWDYECPKAKFLVVNMPVSTRVSAAIHLKAVWAVLVGIATNRLTLFVNNRHKANFAFLKDRWKHANCGRGDMQCLVQPVTPCTTTIKDLQENGVLLPDEELSRFLQGPPALPLPPQYDGKHILVMNITSVSPIMPQSMQTKVQRSLYTTAKTLVGSLRSTLGEDDRMGVLDEALKLVATVKQDLPMTQQQQQSKSLPNRFQPLTPFLQKKTRDWKTAHAALLYLLRPRRSSQMVSDANVQESLPNDIQEDLPVVGLSVGKIGCKDCVQLDQYIGMAQQMLSQNGTANGYLVLKSDQLEIGNSSVESISSRSPLKLIVNNKSGNQHNLEGHNMIQRWTDWKLLMRSDYFVGDCCVPGDTMVLMELLSVGCGQKPNPSFVCLQQYQDEQIQQSSMCGPKIIIKKAKTPTLTPTPTAKEELEKTGKAKHISAKKKIKKETVATPKKDKGMKGATEKTKTVTPKKKQVTSPKAETPKETKTTEEADKKIKKPKELNKKTKIKKTEELNKTIKMTKEDGKKQRKKKVKTATIEKNKVKKETTDKTQVTTQE